MTRDPGGSDIPSNPWRRNLTATNTEYIGSKFFCSAMHADYSVITAKVTVRRCRYIHSPVMASRRETTRASKRLSHQQVKVENWGQPSFRLLRWNMTGRCLCSRPHKPWCCNAVWIVLTLFANCRRIIERSCHDSRGPGSPHLQPISRCLRQEDLRVASAAGQLRDLMYASQRTTAGAFKVYDLSFAWDRNSRQDCLERTAGNQKASI